MTPLPSMAGLITGLPPFLDRRDGAVALHERLGLRVSPRSLEAWDLPWRRVAGRAVCPTGEFFAAALARIEAAPVVRGGRNKRPIEPQQAAA